MSFSFRNPYLVVTLETVPLLFPIEITLYLQHGLLYITHLPSSSSLIISLHAVHLAGVLLQTFSLDWFAYHVHSECSNLHKYFLFTLLGKLPCSIRINTNYHIKLEFLDFSHPHDLQILSVFQSDSLGFFVRCKKFALFRNL